MVEPAIYHKLGIKTFWFMIVEHMLGPLVIFFGILVVIALRATDNDFLMKSFSVTAEKVANINAIIDLFILALVFLWFIVIAITILITWLDYYNYRFCLDEHALEIKRGIIHIEEISIPYHHIQNVDIEQGLMGQLFGLCRTIILTAGHEDIGGIARDGEHGGEAEGILPMIDRDFAEELKKELLYRSSLVYTRVAPPEKISI